MVVTGMLDKSVSESSDSNGNSGAGWGSAHDQ